MSKLHWFHRSIKDQHTSKYKHYYQPQPLKEQKDNLAPTK